MYKVLLADDEILDLEGMKSFIPWEGLGMKVIDSVNNGFSACEVLEREKIDILVTDVRMPNMTGLELAQRALELQEELRIIFVSGYQDFGYVKQAIALNACSYVLKPMEDQELIDALTKVRLELDRLHERKETEEAYQQMIPILKNQYLLQILQRPYDGAILDIIKREYRLTELHWPVCVILLELDNVSTWRSSSLDTEEKLSAMEEYFSKLHKLLEQNGFEYICKVTDQRTAVLLNGGRGKEEIQALLEELKREYNYSMTVGEGRAVHQLEELHTSYTEALAALDYKMFRGKGKWILYSEVPTEDREDVKSLDIRLDALFTAMTDYDIVRIYDELEAIQLLASSIRSKFTIRNLAVYIMVKLEGHLQTMNEELYRMAGLELKNLDILLHFETMDDIFSWLRMKAMEISEMLKNRKSTKNGRLVEEIIENIQARMHENITLRDMANRFSFSPNYLGVLFKEETGHNFSDYVIKLRMERARDLLKTTKLKIYEIASQTGYQYLPYFSRQFKEMYGMTPLEYRRKHS
ncbi:helix-turn-helix domain-containing protein [Paenibacillus sp. MDMC362]|uniref:helix-turn-helix domain-containing protein n=1 Tax=Paenibacillus sp. MDMC362 TaxID=2977365 RepID=UPI000DC524A1|nr:helix-turn-helix domain-containing protein [Paenibacillus sp. MDMC362]RAR44854.1 DNA-binding response regulator [Paenibacillus sp. MDMC362]